MGQNEYIICMKWKDSIIQHIKHKNPYKWRTHGMSYNFQDSYTAYVLKKRKKHICSPKYSERYKSKIAIKFVCVVYVCLLKACEASDWACVLSFSHFRWCRTKWFFILLLKAFIINFWLCAKRLYIHEASFFFLYSVQCCCCYGCFMSACEIVGVDIKFDTRMFPHWCVVA